MVALIGESGSGKTTIALALMGYARRGCRIAGGRVRIGETDVLALDASPSRAACAAAASPTSRRAPPPSFNPSRTIMDAGGRERR